MAEILPSRKACSTNPLKCSAPLGAAMALNGISMNLSRVIGPVAQMAETIAATHRRFWSSR